MEASAMDVSALLRDVRAPTMVLHRRGDRAIPYAAGAPFLVQMEGVALRAGL